MLAMAAALVTSPVYAEDVVSTSQETISSSSTAQTVAQEEPAETEKPAVTPTPAAETPVPTPEVTPDPIKEETQTETQGQSVTQEESRNEEQENFLQQNTTQQSLKDLEKEDSILSADEIAKLKKHFKKSEQVQIQNVSEELLDQINKDIKALKNHELLFETIRNTGKGTSEVPVKTGKLFAEVVNDLLNPSIKFQCYGKVEGNMVSDLLLRVDIWNTVAISHIDTKIDRDIWMKALEKSNLSFDSNVEYDKEQE